MYPYGTKGAPAIGGGLPGLPRRGAGGGGIGSVALFEGEAPPGWVPLDGSVLQQSDYPRLFKSIGFVASQPQETSEAKVWRPLLIDAPGAAAGDGRGTWLVFSGTNSSFPAILHRSEDFGETWDIIDLSSLMDVVRGVATDGKGNWVAVGTGFSNTQNIIRSVDNGKTWSLSSPHTSGSALACVATDKNGVWMVGGWNLHRHRSTDDGATWTAQTSSGTLVNNSVANYGDNWVFTQSTTGAVLQSSDKGLTFTQRTLHTSSLSSPQIRVDRNGKFFVFPGNTVPVRISENGGVNWSVIDGTANLRAAAAISQAGTVLVRDQNNDLVRKEGFYGKTETYSGFEVGALCETDNNGTWLVRSGSELMISRPFNFDVETEFQLPIMKADYLDRYFYMKAT